MPTNICVSAGLSTTYGRGCSALPETWLNNTSAVIVAAELARRARWLFSWRSGDLIVWKMNWLTPRIRSMIPENTIHPRPGSWERAVVITWPFRRWIREQT